MKNAKVIEPNNIKRILAEKFNVPESNIIKNATIVINSLIARIEALENA